MSQPVAALSAVEVEYVAQAQELIAKLRAEVSARPSASIDLDATTEPAKLTSNAEDACSDWSLAAAQCRQLRLDESDYFGRLLATAGNDVIGSVQVRPR